MIPTPIPDEEVWEGARRIVIGPPPANDLTGDIRAVEALVDVGPFGQQFHIRLILEAGELERLQNGEPMWLAIVGAALQPFQVGMTSEEPDGG